MNKIKTYFVLITLFLFIASCTQTYKPTKYSIEQFYQNNRIGGGSFSDDETKLLVSSDESGIFNVYELDIASGEKTQKTFLPEDTPKAQKLAAKIVHNGMYALLIGTVLSGLLIGFLFWIEHIDGIITDIVIIFHEININLLYLFIGIHIVAAIYHRLKRDGVWSSMVPFFKEKKPR